MSFLILIFFKFIEDFVLFNVVDVLKVLLLLLLLLLFLELLLTKFAGFSVVLPFNKFKFDFDFVKSELFLLLLLLLFVLLFLGIDLLLLFLIKGVFEPNKFFEVKFFVGVFSLLLILLLL